MNYLFPLSDEAAEMTAGGWGFTSISFTKYSSVATALGQENKVNNLGLGVLAGFGVAQSLQANGSGITTVVG